MAKKALILLLVFSLLLTLSMCAGCCGNGNGGNGATSNGSWMEMDSGTTKWLDRVWGSSASDVFAVGNGGTILHYDGSSWSEMSGDITRDMRKVWGASASEVFAVGPDGTILRYGDSA